MHKTRIVLLVVSCVVVTTSPTLARIDGGDVLACAGDQPCINDIAYSGGNLTFSWDGQGTRYDKYHIRWSHQGGAEHPHELSGRTTSFTVRNVQPGVAYTFKVSGCTSPVVGKDRCSDWEEQHYTPRPPRQQPPAPAPSVGPRAGVVAWVQSANGDYPQNAIRLGKESDGEALFGCSALVGPPGKQTMQPGKLSRKIGGCNVPFAGTEHSIRNYQVLASSLDYRAFALQDVNGGPLPARAVSGGVDIDGQPLYFCIVPFSDGSAHVGKIQRSWKQCHIGFGGSEQSYNAYKVLVVR